MSAERTQFYAEFDKVNKRDCRSSYLQIERSSMQAVDKVLTCILKEPDNMIIEQPMFGIYMLLNRSP